MQALTENSIVVVNRPKNLQHSGSIRVTWAQCPNRECPSREWESWQVDFWGDMFACGTCDVALERPLFFPHVAGKLCAECTSKFQQPPHIIKPSEAT